MRLRLVLVVLLLGGLLSAIAQEQSPEAEASRIELRSLGTTLRLTFDLEPRQGALGTFAVATATESFRTASVLRAGGTMNAVEIEGRIVPQDGGMILVAYRATIENGNKDSGTTLELQGSALLKLDEATYLAQTGEQRLRLTLTKHAHSVAR